VLIYVLIAGLRGTVVSQVVQFVLLFAGFLPVVRTGLKNIGGWSELNASLAELAPKALPNFDPATIAIIAVVLGFILGAARWTTDFRVLQMAMAAKSSDAARQIPIAAAAFRLAVPFLLVLPGAIAVSLPTPQSKTVVRNENGAIYHEITIVPREISEGSGLVPALIDPATNNARRQSAGHKLFDYGMATPNLLTHSVTTGWLGLAIAALLASLMSGVASGIAAVSTVFACDLYQPVFGKNANDASLLRTGRWAAGISLLLSIGVAFALSAFNSKAPATAISAWLATLAMIFAILQAPQLATFSLGIFTRRPTGTGAFAGLVAGFAIALLHYAVALPEGAQRGLQGGWLADLYRYPGLMTELCGLVFSSFLANLIVTWAVSLSGDPRPKADLESLTYPPSARKPAKAR
jgi:SSS family solute:Na+ symporter